MSKDAPILLVDVDGVISLFGFQLDDAPAGRWALIDGVPHLLSTEAAAQLRRLAADFELVWCTGWEEKADENLPGLLDLPRGLPHLGFDQATAGGAGRPGGDLHGHWKLAAIDAYAGPDRPLAWIDDRLDAACERWAASRAGPTRLVHTSSHEGFTARDADRLLRWRAELRGGPSRRGNRH